MKRIRKLFQYLFPKPKPESEMTTIEKIKKLRMDYDHGFISNEEYLKKKEELFNQ